jgi:hypothetical protein
MKENEVKYFYCLSDNMYYKIYRENYHWRMVDEDGYTFQPMTRWDIILYAAEHVLGDCMETSPDKIEWSNDLRCHFDYWVDYA